MKFKPGMLVRMNETSYYTGAGQIALVLYKSTKDFDDKRFPGSYFLYFFEEGQTIKYYPTKGLFEEI
jgi:hypothetical protein